MRSFVIVVDTQRDFMAADGALSVAGADALVGPMTAWLAGLRPEETAGVLFTYDTHDETAYGRSTEAETFPPHCLRGTAGWENMLSPTLVDPAIPAWRLEKGVFAMWEEAGLTVRDERDPQAAAIPRDVFFGAVKAAGVTRAIVIGVAADYCVRWAIDGLIARGFSVIVPAALTRGIARQIDAVVVEEFAGRPVSVG